MNNRGQISVLFSLIISVLLLFTLTALEVGRIHMSRVKVASVIQSTKLSMMADYNRELFERYHLLFADVTYGTGSQAAFEEKMKDYLETSLEDTKGKIYVYTVEDVQLVNEEGILNQNMKRLKEQVEEYEKTAGITHHAKELLQKTKEKEVDLSVARSETDANAVEIPLTKPENEKESDSDGSENDNTDSREKENTKEEEKDPRDCIKDALKLGILSFVKPASMEISTTSLDFSSAPSKTYQEMEKEEFLSSDFAQIDFLKNFLKEEDEKKKTTLSERASFLDYVNYHFSSAVNQKENSVMKCEIEYILKGKNNDYDNLQSVVNEMVWFRMPVNYAYLLTDEKKKTQALTVAAGICTATGTEALIEIVKYLLLGCWAYGESLCEARELLEGNTIPYVKTSMDWMTDLSNPTVSKKEGNPKSGLTYEEMLMLLLAKKKNSSLDCCYARMLDLIELNMRQEDVQFCIKNYVYEVTVQGTIRFQPLFTSGGTNENYEYDFEEIIKY